jgi:large subunit ribosomal protein L23Ae
LCGICCAAKKEEAKKTAVKKAEAPKKKALKAAKLLKKGTQTTKAKKVRTTTVFRRPKTLALPRKPKYIRQTIPARARLDQYSILKYPLTTESAMKRIEENNTLVFIVDIHANKHQIKDAVKKLYSVQAEKVNTLIRFVCSTFPISTLIHVLTVCCCVVALMARRRLMSALALIRTPSMLPTASVSSKLTM